MTSPRIRYTKITAMVYHEDKQIGKIEKDSLDWTASTISGGYRTGFLTRKAALAFVMEKIEA